MKPVYSSVRVHTGGHQPRADGAQARDAHEEHQGPPGAHQGLEVDVQGLSGTGVAGDDVERGGEVPVGHRNAAIGGHGDGRGHASCFTPSNL